MSSPSACFCTQAQGQPYGSVVAIACTTTLELLSLLLRGKTTKYRLLSECRQVSLVIDSRAAHPDDFCRSMPSPPRARRGDPAR